jgi:O-acetyl-ADP-ribose deacetylase (regulator of RNase III)
MIKYVKGDLLSVTKGVIVHGVNCQGVMGSGVALAIKNAHHKAYLDYLSFVQMYGPGRELLGMVQYVQVAIGLVVANAFTQNSYCREAKRYVSYEAIDTVFADLAEFCDLNTPISMPKIGAGLGGGDWGIIETRLELRLNNHDVTIYEL